MTTATDLLREGASAYQRGRFADAEARMVAAVAAARRAAPADHSFTCVALANLAQLRIASSDLAGAEAVLVEGMDEVGRHGLTGGAAHVMLLQQTAALRGAQGNTSAAEEMLQHARCLLTGGKQDAVLAIVLMRLAELRQRAGKLPDAEALLRERLALSGAGCDVDQQRATALILLANVQSGQGK
jgi:hypothetical protein